MSSYRKGRYAYARPLEARAGTPVSENVPTLREPNADLSLRRVFAVPRDLVELRTNHSQLLDLAARLWDESVATAPLLQRPILLAARVTAGSVPASDRAEHWEMQGDVALLAVGDALQARLDCALGRMEASISAAFVGSHPATVARLLLETPVGAMLARRGYAVFHAGAIAGTDGKRAVVIRGAPGAGKSTLVAAAHNAGLSVLGDEAVLAARDDPDDLVSAVRDLTLPRDSAQLLGLTDSKAPERQGAGKYRIDLFASSSPTRRRARRAATLVFGSRNGGPARLEPLAAEAFLAEFQRGEIPQEQWSGTPLHIAQHWAGSGSYRLSGTQDLAGAVAILKELTQ